MKNKTISLEDAEVVASTPEGLEEEELLSFYLKTVLGSLVVLKRVPKKDHRQALIRLISTQLFMTITLLQTLTFVESYQDDTKKIIDDLLKNLHT